ncbi:MAG: hypothetical protein ABIS45_09625 [Burkholderiales bacterium]
MPPCPFGAGGHLNIFSFVQMLEHRSYECRVIVNSGAWFGPAGEIKRKFCAMFLPIQAPVYTGLENALPAFYTGATGW